MLRGHFVTDLLRNLVDKIHACLMKKIFPLRFPKSTAFTLIELLVVIAVIGILAGVLLMVVNPSEQLKKARDAQRKHDLSQIQKALEVYYNDNGKYPNSGDIPWGQTWLGYMEVVPQDPSGVQSYSYVTRDGGYELSAILDHCSTDCSYSVTSPNVATAGGGVVVVPTNTPTPTTTPGPTNSPTPATSTPTPTPFPYKRVFVTSNTYSANLGGISGADSKCQSSADSVNLGGSWIAWISNSSTAARDRLTHAAVPYKMLDGAIVANNWADLVDGAISSRINVTEHLTSLVSTCVFTATQSDGSSASTRTSYNGDCNNWSSTSDANGVLAGQTSNLSGWTDSCGAWCWQSNPLYCFEQ